MIRHYVVIGTLATALVFTTACGGPTDAQPAVCATYQDAVGTWREEDGETLDDDPCDTDDEFEVDVKKTKKPAPKKTKK